MSVFVRIAFLVVALAASVSCFAQAGPKIEDVKFRSDDGVTLAGALVLPENAVAAAVLVHGSGQEKRMTSWALALAAQGVAVLTYDKRGVGESGGRYAGPEVGTHNVNPENLDLLAADAAAAVKELKGRLARNRVPVGLIGVSQAGWIIPLTAARSPDVRFMVLWSGPLVTTLEQLRFQFFTEQKPDFWDRHTEAQVREHIRTAPDRYPMVDTDPRVTLKKLSIPGLWLFGGRDLNLPAHLCMERLDALTASGKPFEHQLFADAGHGLPGKEAMAATVEWLKKKVVVQSP